MHIAKEEMNMAENLADLVPKSLRTLLKETLFRAGTGECYVINPEEPGFVDTLKSLSAAEASKPPQPGRKPVVSHANHVLYGLDLVARAVHGDMHAFDNTDWSAAWKLESVTDAEWRDLVARLEKTAADIVEAGPNIKAWEPIMLTGLFAVAAHTAYHLGAIRQILLDVKA
jgi:hypothetical protein